MPRTDRVLTRVYFENKETLVFVGTPSELEKILNDKRFPEILCADDSILVNKPAWDRKKFIASDKVQKWWELKI